MGRKVLRPLLTGVIDVLIVVAIALAIRQFVVFSGQIAAQNWAQTFNAVAKHLVVPFGVAHIKTPYGGVFDVNNALTIVLALAVEWGLSVVRDRA